MKKSWKKTAVCVLSVLVLLLSGACSSGTVGTQGDKASEETVEETVNTESAGTKEAEKEADIEEEKEADNETAQTSGTGKKTAEALAAVETEDFQTGTETDLLIETEEVFSKWNEDAPSLQALTEFVEKVTEEGSDSFIPEKDRIAVFDMDGTLMGELYPTYLEYYMR